jgi:hypothetical protein
MCTNRKKSKQASEEKCFHTGIHISIQRKQKIPDIKGRKII